jgi:hypothetical protein
MELWAMETRPEFEKPLEVKSIVYPLLLSSSCKQEFRSKFGGPEPSVGSDAISFRVPRPANPRCKQ